jgi:predicted nucleic acid-binding protein
MWLLDGNLLVALAIDSHEFHDRAQRWFDLQAGPFATCALTEGTLLRVHMTVAEDNTAAAA